jgi:hypothetical protein
VYLDVAPPPALPPPPPPCSRLRRVEAADADSSEDVDGLGTELGPELGDMMAATTAAAPAASADASAALTSLQEADYCGFSSLSESSKHAASIAAGDDEEEEEEPAPEMLRGQAERRGSSGGLGGSLRGFFGFGGKKSGPASAEAPIPPPAMKKKLKLKYSRSAAAAPDALSRSSVRRGQRREVDTNGECLVPK